MGRTKQLLSVEGRPMLQHPIDTAEAAGVDEVVVVLGHDADRVAEALRLPDRARIVVNPHFTEGQASSLRAGLNAAAAAPDSEAVVILLGDQPGIAPGAIRALVEEFRRNGGRVVRAVYGGRPGHPVLLSRRCWDDVATLEGDVGARALVEAHPEWVVDVEVGGVAPPDVDTPRDYHRLLESPRPKHDPPPPRPGR